MAKIEITVPGERIVQEFTALVSQPTAPSTSRSPDVGLVEISHVQPTELVPGPPGPPGVRGSRWFFGDGVPVSPGTVLGDVYLDDITGKIYVWNGTSWVDTGTDLSPDASELLAKLLTVDGVGSGLDADTLDGHDSTYFATDADMTAIEGRMTTNEAKDVSQDNNLATINADQITQNNRMTAIEAVNTTQDTNIALKANIASPTFTGDPKAPTPATADNDTSIATTAYVKANTALISQFPEAPNDGLTYGRKNLAWSTIVGGAVVSDTAPGAPLQNGQLWFKSNSGDTYIYVVDANSSQWVQQNVLPASGQYPVATAETRNRIVNGGFQISQENATNPVGNGGYPADMWQLVYFSSSTVTSNMVGKTAINMLASPAETSMAATEQGTWVTKIEGIRLTDFGLGTATSKQFILAFDVYMPVAGTYHVSITNSGVTHSWVGAYTVSAGEVSAWVRKTVVVPEGAINAGTWLTDTGIGMLIRFTVCAGSTYIGVAGMQGGNFLAGPGQALGLSTTNPCYLGDVGLYRDPLKTGVAPAWTEPDEAEELLACRRYWWCSNLNTPKGGPQGTLAGNSLVANYIGLASWRFTLPMRIAPTLSIWFNGTANQARNVSTGATVATGAITGVANLSPEGWSNMNVTSITAGLWVDFDIQANARL